jgi:hypothetical protein
LQPTSFAPQLIPVVRPAPHIDRKIFRHPLAHRGVAERLSAKEINIMKRRMLVITCLLLASGLVFGCGGGVTSQSPVSGKGEAAPQQTVPSNIQNGIETDMKAECTKYHKDNIYDLQILKAGQGNVTQKMQSGGIEEVWCVTVTAKCGNLKRTRNFVYVKQPGNWEKTGGEYSPREDYWQSVGCPFSMRYD